MSTFGNLMKRALVPPSARTPVTIEHRASQVMTFSGPIGSVGQDRLAWSADDELNGYQANEVVYRCEDFIATSLAMLDLVVREGDEIDEEDPTANLFNKSSEDADNAVARKRIMWGQLERRGECFIYMDRGDTGEGDVQDFLIIPGRVVPKIDMSRVDGTTGELKSRRQRIAPHVVGFDVHTEHGVETLLASEVLWLRYPHPDIPFAPLAPGRAALMPALLDRYAREWQMGMLQNQAMPGGLVNLGEAATVEQAEMERARFESRNGGARNAGRYIFTGGGAGDTAGFDRMALSPVEMSYIESHNQNGRDICRAYGVPEDQIFGDSTFNNQSGTFKQMWANWLGKLQVVSSELDRVLWPEPERSAEFDTRQVPALQENADAIHARVLAAAEADLYTLAEAREKIGEQPFGDLRDQMTLSQFRAWISSPVPAETDAQTVRYRVHLPPLPPVDEISQGAVERLRELEAPDQRASINPSEIIKPMDRHERRIKAAVAELADEQQKVVLRELDKAQSKRRKAIDYRVDQLRKQAAREIPNVTEAQLDQLLPELEKRAEEIETRISISAIFNVGRWIAETIRKLRPTLDSPWHETANAVADKLGVDVTDDFSERISTAMEKRLADIGEKVTETTHKVLEEELLKPGIVDGESIPELRDRITQRFDQLKTSRAEMIARTETQYAVHAAGQASAEASGVVSRKEWLVSPTCDHGGCLDLNADAIGLSDEFAPGVAHPPLHPQCRCTVLWLTDDGEDG